MAKRKKETAKSEKVKINKLSGKVTKAKNSESIPETPSTRKVEVKLFRTPLKPRQEKTPPQDSVSATHFLEQSMSKCTSTPVNVDTNAKGNDLIKRTRSGRAVILNRKYKDIIPFSPILADIGNVPGRKPEETKKPLKGVNPTPASRSNKSNEVAEEKENSPSVASTCRRLLLPHPIGTVDSENPSKRPVNTRKRRSVGIRRVVTSPDNETVDKSTSRRRKAPKTDDPLEEHCLVKRLRADWSSSTIGTPSQIDSIRAKSPQKQQERQGKRRLTTLIEISLDDSSVPSLKPKATSTAAKTKPTEEPYSSSAEFESDDEKENSRSKRAPTWKDLSKVMETILQTPPKVRVRRSRIQSTVATRSSKRNQTSTPRVRVRLSRMKSLLSPKKTRSSIPESNLESVALNNNNPKEADCNLVLATPAAVLEKGNKAVNAQESGTDKPVSPSPRPQNILNKSDLIEQILSSSADGDEENITPPTLNSANHTKKFFHSRTENAPEVPQTVKPVKAKRSSGRRKKQDNIYEFLSQSSSDATDPNADVIQKMIKTGKVTVAKHDKGKGKPKRIRIAKQKKPTATADVFVKPKPVSKPKPLQERVVNTVAFDDEPHFDDGGGVDDFEDFPSRDQRGFSYLARSAMIKQAGKNESTPTQRKMVTDRKKLLEMAQKFVGQSPSPSASASAARLSPILGSASPWRVDDDHLPNTFYFNRNSDNLPSFSSDYIPPTPTKNKSKSKSSFSSNDSDMENIAPPSTSRAAENENHTQTALNTRRALSYRSPLKAINIIEVIDLPPLAMDNTVRETNKETTRRDKSSLSNTSLFGFEEFIEDDEDISEISIDPEALSNKQHLKMNLQRLKRLRPEKPVATTSKNTRIKPVFDERPKPRTIQQMLCSTMIERQRQSELANDASQGACDLSNLFKDPEPETTFDESNPRRTYSRPFTRKRKLRHNFVMFMDSDASDDEEDAKIEKNKKAAKKRKQDPKERAELNKFVDEFNEMCKEVSQYELIVE